MDDHSHKINEISLYNFADAVEDNDSLSITDAKVGVFHGKHFIWKTSKAEKKSSTLSNIQVLQDWRADFWSLILQTSNTVSPLIAFIILSSKAWNFWSLFKAVYTVRHTRALRPEETRTRARAPMYFCSLILQTSDRVSAASVKYCLVF